MLARERSLDAVYTQDWAAVVNFIALDPMYETLADGHRPGRSPRAVVGGGAFGHQHVLRWYSVIDAWRYDAIPEFNYGDDTTYCAASRSWMVTARSRIGVWLLPREDVYHVQ